MGYMDFCGLSKFFVVLKFCFCEVNLNKDYHIVEKLTDADDPHVNRVI